MSKLMGGDICTILLSLDGFFFFQAEDGIRDVAVTGVQTCALPISLRRGFDFLFLPNKHFSRSSLQLHAEVPVHEIGRRSEQFQSAVWNRRQGGDAIALYHAQRVLVRGNGHRAKASFDKPFHHLHLARREFWHFQPSVWQGSNASQQLSR